MSSTVATQRFLAGFDMAEAVDLPGSLTEIDRRVIRLARSFSCPRCGRELRVSGVYRIAVGVVSLGTSAWLTYRWGIRGLSEFEGMTLALAMPVAIVVLAVLRKVTPTPKLISDDSSFNLHR